MHNPACIATALPPPSNPPRWPNPPGTNDQSFAEGQVQAQVEGPGADEHPEDCHARDEEGLQEPFQAGRPGGQRAGNVQSERCRAGHGLR